MQRTILCFLVIVSGTAALCAQTAKAPRLDGDWVVVFTFYDSNEYRRFTLQQRGEELTGTMGDFALTGTVRDGKVEMKGNPKEGPGASISAQLRGEEMAGEAVWRPYGEEEQAKFRAYRPKTRPDSAPRTHAFEPKEFHRNFSGSIAPALHIFPGDTVKTWTVDAGGFDSAGVRRSLGGNPQTGPFYIEGALPGDTLVIQLNKVRLNRDTASSSGAIRGSALNPYYLAGLKKPEKPDSNRWRLDREKGVAVLTNPTEKLKNYTVPLRPMLGCIGVAPAGDMSFRTAFLGSYGGNMDYNEMREGVTVYLPVFQPGALLFVGDGHAAQGDGELTGSGLETSMDVEFTVDLVRGQSHGSPRAENSEYLMAMGIAGSLNEALQSATTSLARWLERDYKLNPSEVASVLGTAMRYDIAEVVDPYVHVVARISKRALSPIPK